MMFRKILEDGTTVTTINTIGIISDAMEMTLTDLHTHILPGVDDGAKDLEASLEILRKQKKSGVERVALTSHFYPMREELQDFLDRRQRAYEELLYAWDVDTMPQLRLGAEVHYSSSIADMDLRKLSLAQSDYLLVELSDTMVPAHIEQVLKIILSQGITPILAHVERCAYFMEDPSKLLHLIELGALAQITTRALHNKRRQKFAEICLQKNVAQIIASDVHGIWELKTGLGALKESLSGGTIERAEAFARAVWDNTPLPVFEPEPIKRKLFGYA
ncbi:MAG: capsular biosynthesis protein [Oscillospiraceae bacterium]|nr:capsular biosynthesis protein [Oscillospiraceae bacterium]